MEQVSIHITLRGPLWRVRIIIPGEQRPLWRMYRRSEYPDPDDVVQRVVSRFVSAPERQIFVSWWGWLYPTGGHSPGQASPV